MKTLTQRLSISIYIHINNLCAINNLTLRLHVSVESLMIYSRKEKLV
jgi:hypothetical protein